MTQREKKGGSESKLPNEKFIKSLKVYESS